MDCPVCAGKIGAVDSTTDCEAVYRKRKCLQCGYVFYTAEFEDETAYENYKRIKNEREKKRYYEKVRKMYE